jgi:tetratricopeptide (TPR) repeat protein
VFLGLRSLNGRGFGGRGTLYWLEVSQIRKPPASRAAPSTASRPRHGWRILLLWALAGAAYSNSFQSAPVFDGAKIVAQDSRIRAVTPENIRLIIGEEYWYKGAPSGLYRPLTTFSLLLNYAALGNGANPAGYHWTNFALHGINVTLVYALGLLIFADPALALALAALWGFHPLLTDSVTNIAGRADLLAAFGVLAAWLCYMKGTATQGRRRLAWLAAMVAAQAAGLFAKENAAVLPGILLLYDLAWPERATWRARAPAYAALALPMALWLYLRGQVQTHMLIHFMENPLVSAGFLTARLTAVKVIGKLLWLFVWPARLSADYSYNAIRLFGWHVFEWEDAKAVIALAVCLSAALLVLRWRHRRKPLFFFLAFFFIALVPTANLVILIGSIMAERFAYLPSLGLAGCAVAALHELGRRVPFKPPASARAASAGLAFVCLGLAARTYTRNLDWRDELSFWTSTVNVSPGSARAHNNLGNTFLRMPGRLPDAIAEFEAALRILPDYTDAHYNLGNALAQIPGRGPDAIAEYQRALRIEPDFAQAHINLGNLLSQIPGRIPDAIAQFEAALRTEPDLADAHYNLGTILAQIPGRGPDAVAQFQATLRIQPGSAKAHNTLGSVLSQMPGRQADAIAEYQAALRLQPDYARAHYNLGNILSQMPGRQSDAIAEYRAALRIQPDYADAHNNLANIFLQMPGRGADAIAEYQAALRFEPNLAEAHANLASALAQMPGRGAEAIAEYEAALRISPDPEVRRRLDRLLAGKR